jgi:aquaporin Z
MGSSAIEKHLSLLIEHPSFPIRNLIQPVFERRVLIGLAMGITTVLLMYFSRGEIRGHLNPAVTLTFLILKRISRIDALFYIPAQFIGGLLAVESVALLIPSYIHHPDVNKQLSLVTCCQFYLINILQVPQYFVIH